MARIGASSTADADRPGTEICTKVGQLRRITEETPTISLLD
jgi:hypothetical protein